MTSNEIRQSFLDFFKSKQHTIVPSSSLMPDSPNLLFTNAGMNQFVPIFLGQVPCPYNPPRAADTQKCIRAGGKHNDLEDVGLDTYHHTFFEMLGNWSFGDYFKKEAIDWAWELVTGVWKFPKDRLYATVYNPDKSKGDPSDFDQEAWDVWAGHFRAAGLDPAVHIVNGNKKDNFWMMGETGPCGPCSELHVDLTPTGDTRGSLVNKGTAECIEIWNLVFIQFNANPDGTFSPLPAKHVDTGMGFERVTAIMQGTKSFTDFGGIISNYETDVFRPIFGRIEELSPSKAKYKSTLPKSGSTGDTEQEKIDVAFRVIADHIRTLSFAISDGILPGNTDRNYVLRRILRRAVRYGRTLGFHRPFFFQLVDVVTENFGHVFPEVHEKRGFIQKTIRSEEEAFNKTLDKGIEIFNQEVSLEEGHPAAELINHESLLAVGQPGYDKTYLNRPTISGELAFKLYDTYGFPLDLTELMARERGLTVDTAGFDKLMEAQKQRARAGQKKEIIAVANIVLEDDTLTASATTLPPTSFVGYESLFSDATVLNCVTVDKRKAVILDISPAYAEMGGQVGDSGVIEKNAQLWRITNTRKHGDTWFHFIDDDLLPAAGDKVRISVDRDRRNAIQRHHTVTHLFHWALHEVASKDALQKGSYVGPEKLTFDFNSAPLTPQQVRDIERLVNERIIENAPVSWTEIPYAEVKKRGDITHLFGEKYGDQVRVVQIGGTPQQLNGYSMELCGGTHTRGTGEIGYFRIVGESAIAAGVRRVEAVAGSEAYNRALADMQTIQSIAGKLNSPVGEVEKKLESLLAHQKELEKQLKSLQQKQAAETARSLVNRATQVGATRAIIQNLGQADGDYLQSIADALKSDFKGVIVLGGASNGAVALVAAVSPDLTSKFQAGKIIQAIAPIVGGKGGGRPDNARGGGKDASQLDAALKKAEELLKS